MEIVVMLGYNDDYAMGKSRRWEPTSFFMESLWFPLPLRNTVYGTT